MIRRVRRLLADEDGQATVETAFALSTLIAVLMVALGAIAVVAMHLAVTDAAGHIARDRVPARYSFAFSRWWR